MTTRQFTVGPTTPDRRARAKGEFIVCVNDAVQADLGLGRWAALEHQRTFEDGAKPRDLRVIARVVIDNTLPETQLLTDQTCRNAIGIPFQYDRDETRVGLRPVHVSRRQDLAALLARLVGKRYVVLRVHKGDIPDMEKRLARMTAGLFPVVGVPPGGRLVVESAQVTGDALTMATVGVRALPLGDDAITRVKELEEPRAGARFVDAENCLGIKPDIGEIFLDLNERQRLGVDSLDPVRVRRGLGDMIKREIIGAGLVFFVSLLGVSSTLPWDGGWLKFAVVAAAATLVSSLILVLKLRAHAD